MINACVCSERKGRPSAGCCDCCCGQFERNVVAKMSGRDAMDVIELESAVNAVIVEFGRKPGR